MPTPQSVVADDDFSTKLAKADAAVGHARAVLDRLGPNAPGVLIYDLDWNEDERLRDWLRRPKCSDASRR